MICARASNGLSYMKSRASPMPKSWSVRIVVSIVDFDYTPSSIDPGSNPGRTSIFSIIIESYGIFFYK